MSVKVEVVSKPVLLGEGPHWHDAEQALYFVDIQGKTIHKHTPATATHTTTTLDGRIGFIVPVEGFKHQFVVGLERKFLVIEWDGTDAAPARVVRELAEVDRGAKTRINDGKADPRGRLFAGTMSYEPEPGVYDTPSGSLFRLDPAGATTLATRIGISNGLAWDLTQKAFYYTDSLERKIRRYDYDVDTGHISNMKYVFDFKNTEIKGFPDGTTIDTDGNLWVAMFHGSSVVKIDPRTGALLQRVQIPAPQVTSATFGGPNMDILFVTSANWGEADHTELSGATFMVTGLGVKGHKNENFKIPQQL